MCENFLIRSKVIKFWEGAKKGGVYLPRKTIGRNPLARIRNKKTKYIPGYSISFGRISKKLGLLYQLK